MSFFQTLFVTSVSSNEKIFLLIDILDLPCNFSSRRLHYVLQAFILNRNKNGKKDGGRKSGGMKSGPEISYLSN